MYTSMSWFIIDGVKKSVTILLALLLLVSCTRLSYPEETRPMFGGEASVILTEGGDDMILERVFALLEELESEYESGVLPSDLQQKLKRAEELTGAELRDADTAWRCHAADAAAAFLQDEGVRGAAVSVAGAVHVIGHHPDGGPWQVAMADPVPGRSDTYAVTEVPEGAAITVSGDYSDIASVTVLSKDGILALLAGEKAAFLGRDKGEELIRTLGLDAVMLTRSDEIVRISGQE